MPRCLARRLPRSLPPFAEAIMGLKGTFWEPGQVLGVRFLNGSTALQSNVMKRFDKWTELGGNLSYKQTTSKGAEIRVAFPNDGASWSYIGTDALHIPLNQQTINFGWFDNQTDDAELDRTGLHEIGHSRGYLHEHTRPEVLALLNKAAVYADLMGPPNNWTKADVDAQVFNTPDPSTVVETPVDINSIMEYPWSAADTLNHVAIVGGQELTAYDIQLDKQLYPWPSTPTTPTQPTPPVVTPAGSPGPWTTEPLPNGGIAFRWGSNVWGGKMTAMSLLLRPMAHAPAKPDLDDFSYSTPKPGDTMFRIGRGRIGSQW